MVIVVMAVVMILIVVLVFAIFAMSWRRPAVYAVQRLVEGVIAHALSGQEARGWRHSSHVKASTRSALLNPLPAFSLSVVVDRPTFRIFFPLTVTYSIGECIFFLIFWVLTTTVFSLFPFCRSSFLLLDSASWLVSFKVDGLYGLFLVLLALCLVRARSICRDQYEAIVSNSLSSLSRSLFPIFLLGFKVKSFLLGFGFCVFPFTIEG